MGNLNFYNRIKIGPKLIALFLLVGAGGAALVGVGGFLAFARTGRLARRSKPDMPESSG